MKKGIWYLYSGTISKFFPPPNNEDKNRDAFPVFFQKQTDGN
jgi:hypothetical protein